MKIYAVIQPSWKEGRQIEKILPINYLLSFYYISGNNYKDILNKGKAIIIDSGAFTLQKNLNKDVNQYIEEYKEFIKKIRYNPKVDGFFEMDIDNQIGYSAVQDIRNDLFDLTDKIIPVWHKSLGIPEYKRMCREYDYISFSGVNKEDIHRNNFKHFVKEAHKHGTKVHGLGVSRKEILDTVPFDSVDASSWMEIVQFGKKLNGVQLSSSFIKENAHRLRYYCLLKEQKRQIDYERYWNEKLC